MQPDLASGASAAPAAPADQPCPQDAAVARRAGELVASWFEATGQRQLLEEFSKDVDCSKHETREGGDLQQLEVLAMPFAWQVSAISRNPLNYTRSLRRIHGEPKTDVQKPPGRRRISGGHGCCAPASKMVTI